MTTDELRSCFLIQDLFAAGRAEFVYTDVDRAIVGGIVPTEQGLALTAGHELASEYFFERREAGVINLGADGSVSVDGEVFPLASREFLYIGRGSREIAFASATPESPAVFYLVSYPAHADHPTTHAELDSANRVDLGSQAAANRRTMFQYVHPGGIRSCQLMMGFAELHEGTVWNTFPPHTHGRRSEAYCYFDLPEDGLVIHLLGAPDETRHLVVREKEVALSPSWSIHSGAGTGGYRFVWAMGGENQAFEDIDPVKLGDLR
jgi:4-deoxy-L-threo-5-hexosulose-uronate ketol-isomerase